jgi:RNA polymerase sigma-B factor
LNPTPTIMSNKPNTEKPNRKLSNQEKEVFVLDYVRTNSPSSRRQAIHVYTPLVEYIARKLAFNKDDVPDLSQVGAIGLLKSLENFDPSKEIAFSTFASSNIIGEIKHYLRDKCRIVKLPRKLQETYSKIRQLIKVETQKNNKPPTVKDIAFKLDVSEDIVIQSMEAGQSHRVLSLDKPLGSSGDFDDSFTLMDSLGVESKDDHLLNKEVLKQALLSLPDRGQRIIYLRYYEGLTQKEIATRMRLSQMHISRLLNDSIKKLKRKLK